MIIPRITFRLLMAIVISICVIPDPALATTTESTPVFEGNSISRLEETSATLEAKINPEGLETRYEFWLECGTSLESGFSCQSNPLRVLMATGSIAADVGKGQLGEGENVGVRVSGLSPGDEYRYTVMARNAADKSEYYEVRFETPRLGSCPCNEGPIYVAGTSGWSIASANAAAERAVQEQEAQKARERQASEETTARERAHWEAVNREGELRLKREEQAEAESRDCVVPSLKGDSIATARRRLTRVHCKLGRISGLRGRHEGETMIVGQSLHVGTRLAPGARVGVTMRVRTRLHR